MNKKTRQSNPHCNNHLFREFTKEEELQVKLDIKKLVRDLKQVEEDFQKIERDLKTINNKK